MTSPLNDMMRKNKEHLDEVSMDFYGKAWSELTTGQREFVKLKIKHG